MDDKRKLLVMGIALFLLNGCASMSKEECASADWHAIGLDKGADGYAISEYEKLKKACAKHEFSANDDEFYKGYNEGLERHCTPYGGLTLGESGRAYQNVCSPDKETTFMPPYQKAREFTLAKRALNNAKSEVTRRTNDLNALNRTIESDRSQLSTIKDTKEYNEKVKALNSKIADYQVQYSELPIYQNRVIQAQTKLDQIKPAYEKFREDFLRDNPAPAE